VLLQTSTSLLESQVLPEIAPMGVRFSLFVVALLFAPLCWGQGADRIDHKQNPTTIIGPRNLPLYDGAQELLAGNNAEGVRLTHQGLLQAHGRREEEAALSNLCAGYIKLELYDKALKYCDLLLARNDRNWRGYNNRAVIFIMTEKWEKAEQDLISGEALRPGANTMKVARAMYMDAVHPVAPEIEIDDRQRKANAQEDQQ
jgi:tetratricopeptide (TPR) repeat protein